MTHDKDQRRLMKNRSLFVDLFRYFVQVQTRLCIALIWDHKSNFFSRVKMHDALKEF